MEMNKRFIMNRSTEDESEPNVSRDKRASDVSLSDLPEDGYYHVVVLSNFAVGFDKYSRVYDKSAITESTFPNQFFVLCRNDIQVGINKAGRLLRKLELENNRLVLLRVDVDTKMLKPNTKTGLGQYIEASSAIVKEAYIARNYNDIEVTRWARSSFEAVTNESLKLLYGAEPDWYRLVPRSVSILPIALGCQAKCNFCFSHASISADQKHRLSNLAAIRGHLRHALDCGAQRAVITGGGEPGLLPFAELVELVKLCGEYYSKVVLISNGYSLANLSNTERSDRLSQLHDAGLSVLSISRHHYLSYRNASIMHLDTRSESVAQTWNSGPGLTGLDFRWVCVLQKNGIASIDEVEAYVEWSIQNGVKQICFKELYVSTSNESIYHDSSYNEWSRQNQVPLKVVFDWAELNSCTQLFQLPWGAPVFRCRRNGLYVDIAAYTEPSVYWELTNGTCRSWNIMADGLCYASLEDRKSLIRGAREV